MFIIQEIPSLVKPRQQILALGSDTRQRISWADQGRIFSLWPEKDILNTQDFYESACAFISKKLQFKPKILSFDPHPLFVSNQQSLVLRDKYFPKASLVGIFHHVAHVAHFGFEKGLTRDFIGVAFDGTGYGADGLIWGGEFFIYQKNHFKRAAHLKNLFLPGNEKAIQEPWRIAFGILYKIYGKNIFRMKLEFFKNRPKEELVLICQMVDTNFNTPQASSAGRLFDAVCALLNIKTIVLKEAEAAVALEKTALSFKGNVAPYSFDVKNENGIFLIDYTPCFKEIVKDVKAKKGTSEIAFRFHKTLASAIARTCKMLKKKYGVRDVFLSGGVFMNDLLRQEVTLIFKEQGLKSFFASRPVMTTDSGISLGQIAACLMEKTCA
jgi:hydrogenase maturation protein HypF